MGSGQSIIEWSTEARDSSGREAHNNLKKQAHTDPITHVGCDENSSLLFIRRGRAPVGDQRRRPNDAPLITGVGFKEACQAHREERLASEQPFARLCEDIGKWKQSKR